jgi:hypothetical protein
MNGQADGQGEGIGCFCDYANVPKNIKMVKLSPTNAMNTKRGQRYSSINS